MQSLLIRCSTGLSGGYTYLMTLIIFSYWKSMKLEIIKSMADSRQTLPAVGIRVITNPVIQSGFITFRP